MIKHLNIKIFGQVQGVSFRYYTQEKARELDIKGFVKNEPDSSVYIEAEGEESNLERFLQWCHQGPGLARIKRVDVREEELKNYKEFSIEF